MATRWPRLVPLLAFLYLPFISGGPLTDDFAHVEHLTRIPTAARIVDAPDTFGFYRPVTQASIALDLAVHGPRPSRLRALNVVLHACVIGLAFLVARLVLGSPLAAGLATLAFAMTPKAHPIAVLWISARAELLMSAFSLIAVAAWIRWTRNGRVAWLLGAAGAYILALLSKETATLLPILLLFTPGSQRTRRSRAGAVAALCGLAIAIYVWRAHIGALTPFSGDAHYDVMIGASRWARSLQNYTGRMIAGPLALTLLFLTARFVDKRRAARAGAAGTRGSYSITANLFVFPLAWVIAFLAPVLPIAARSELYLYLPVFGVCLIAGLLAQALIWNVAQRRTVAVAVAVYVVTFGAYQVARGIAIHRELVFSETLVEALRRSPEVTAYEGAALLVVPADGTTERFLQDAIGGYLSLVLQHALGSTRMTGTVQYRNSPKSPADLRLLCTYQPDAARVVISPAP
jgi:protein O-mannosyl-transferase